jgi:ABC-type Fe3+/spermidine/putrescine transport system ATPase subunit
MTNAVEATDLVCKKGTFTLGPCTFVAGPEARVAIVGPSGSGKSTLLRCIAGLDRPASGSIRIHGAVAHDERNDVPPDRRGAGFVFQDGALWAHMTALQHLRFAAPSMSDADARALLRRGGVEHVATRRPAEMSGGEAQRVGLLRTLAANPRVLLLDEPLRSVDVHQRDALVLLLRELADERKLPTILVTHDRDEALALADEIFVMRDGRIVERGAATTLLASPKTACTAAFLAGAACLPVEAHGQGQVATPFGSMPARGDAAQLRLVLLPGDVAASPSTTGSATTGSLTTGSLTSGRALACTPHGADFLVRVAFRGQIVPASSPVSIRPGTDVELRLARPARVLPWDDLHSDALPPS